MNQRHHTSASGLLHPVHQAPQTVHQTKHSTSMQTTRIKRAKRPLPPSMGYTSTYAAPISKAAAQRLQAPWALPRMGHETATRDNYAKHTNPHLRSCLYVRNICGDYYLACAVYRVDEWPTQFGVEII